MITTRMADHRSNQQEEYTVMYAKLTRFACLALTLSALGACVPPQAADTGKMAEIERMARQALDAATNAAQRADNALSVASEAAHEASQAKSAAESAQSCCNENRDRMDRMFQKSMRK